MRVSSHISIRSPCSRGFNHFFKAYNDYSDLDRDGVVDTTYKHSFDYYGYFDSYKCYVYENNRYEPSDTTEDKYCTDENDWSGNFLNWASMTRIDFRLRSEMRRRSPSRSMEISSPSTRSASRNGVSMTFSRRPASG